MLNLNSYVYMIVFVYLSLSVIDFNNCNICHFIVKKWDTAKDSAVMPIRLKTFGESNEFQQFFILDNCACDIPWAF